MIALVGMEVLDNGGLLSGFALVCDSDSVVSLVQEDELPAGVESIQLSGGIIAPGLVDLQVNGGGGALLNNSIDKATVLKMAKAHAGFGTRYILPTFISDAASSYQQVIDAVEAATKENHYILGLHLEGPHFSHEKRGVHAPSVLREMSEADVDFLCAAAQRIRLLVTLSPERVSLDKIARLTKAGIVVSLGHSGASFAQSQMAFGAGALSVTHLFNAMSGISAREPGLLGAALDNSEIYCGLIADGHHVHSASIWLALNSKPTGKVYLVSDAMATAASECSEMELYGETISVHNGRLVNAEGKLAGSHSTLADCVKHCVNEVGVPLVEALRMASLYPAQLLGVQENLELRSASLASLIYVVTNHRVTGGVSNIMPLRKKLEEVGGCSNAPTLERRKCG